MGTRKNQEEKVLGVIGKVIVAAFKVILLVVSMFLTIWAMSLVDSLESILVTNFYDHITQINELDKGLFEDDEFNLFEKLMNIFQSYVYIGVSHVIFIVLKLYLIGTIIFKLPGYFFDILDIKSEDIGDQIMQTVQDTQSREGMKGI